MLTQSEIAMTGTPRAARGDGPDFICVGAQKAGTRWLYDQVAFHPAFWMPPVKELHFFDGAKPGLRKAKRLQGAIDKDLDSVNRMRVEDASPPLGERDLRFVRGYVELFTDKPLMKDKAAATEAYARLFREKGGDMTGDVTPAYSKLGDEAVTRMARRFPDARVVFLMRDPVERAWSAIGMVARQARSKLKPPVTAEMVRKHLNRNDVMGRSFPSQTVARWRRIAGDDRFAWFFFDDLRTDPAGLRARIRRCRAASSRPASTARASRRSSSSPTRFARRSSATLPKRSGPAPIRSAARRSNGAGSTICEGHAMPVIKVDNKEIEVPPEFTLLQACEAAGAEIPRFCFHDRLSIAGNCRMCLVELKGAPKPVASCAWSVRDCRPGPNGEPPEVITKSKMVRRAREGVMEFLLINHPLDCPICDQGGECDLQDQAMAYGVDGSRFKENKRAVEDKYIGPLVKTIMTRCIHCTRCIRFSAEVAGVPELGATGRGEDMEITTYLERAMTSELQGNVIDLCPVGALTSKPYAFQARPWELVKTESIDVMDAVGSAIRVDTRGREVMRILPRLNELVNEEWISDKTRFIWDGLRAQRLDRPYVRKDGRLLPATWGEAFATIAGKVAASSGKRMGAIAGDLAGAEEMFALKALMESLGSPHVDCRQDGTKLDPKSGRASYVFNPGIAGIDQADLILLVGTNPRREAAVLNARLRRRWREAGVKIALVGEPVELTYPVDYLGAGPETLGQIAAGEGDFAKLLAAAKRPLVIVGQGALVRPDGAAILSLAAKLAGGEGRDAGWNGLAVLHTAAARVGGLDLGFVPGEGGHDVIGMITAAGQKEMDVLFLRPVFVDDQGDGLNVQASLAGGAA
ncbi:MAG: NADH-quinone oxidoreductase subunit G, partial [Rhizobiales bacterium]|nr:NADH-quinone oxidoreductase subunit G [Hyphomicrobiales bacterium]